MFGSWMFISVNKCVVALLLTVFFFQSCYAKDTQSFTTITPAIAYKLMQELPDELVVDVRTESEFNTGYIKNAVLIPLQDLGSSDAVFEVERPVFLYCAVGGRSYFAGKYLKSKGVQTIYSIGGGIEAWRKEGLPVELK